MIRLRSLYRSWSGGPPRCCRGDFLKHLPKEFVDSLGKQRKYTGSRLLDLLQAHGIRRITTEDMPDSLKKAIGPLPDGYLGFWARRFPQLADCLLEYRIQLPVGRGSLPGILHSCQSVN